MSAPHTRTYSVASGAINGGRYLGGLFSGALALDDVAPGASYAVNQSAMAGAVALDDFSTAGLFEPAPSTDLVLVGDSLMDPLYGELHEVTWLNALAGGKLKTIANLGVAGNTVGDILARIDNSYTATPPGMAGLGTVGWVVLRVGTNNTRGGSTINGTAQTQYASLIAKLKAYASRVIVLGVPPVGAPESGAGVNSYNTWLASYCATVSGVTFIDDTTGVNNGSGDWVSGYAPGDGIHFGGKAAQRMAADGAAAFAAALAPYDYASPISTDSADKYPTNPQWVTNHVMSGTGGTNSLGSGSVPTGWAVSSYGTGFTATTSIVAADVGDPNQTPWLRITPTAVTNAAGGHLQFVATMAGRTITTLDPNPLELVAEYRFNSLDASRFSVLRAYVYGASNENMTAQAKLQMGDATLNGSAVARTSRKRPASAVSHASASLKFELVPNQIFSGSMGSIDVRCATVRG